MFCEETKPLLAIGVLTYNRASFLRRTLEVFSSFDLRGSSVTIFDNASTDDTERVCHMFSGKIANLTIIRQKSNLRFAGNYISALLELDGIYCWVIADDDDFDKEAFEMLYRLLMTRQPDVLLVGGPDIQSWEWGYAGYLSNFMKSGARFYLTAGFLPALIFKKIALGKNVCGLCVWGAPFLWPHIAVIDNFVNANIFIRVVDKAVVSRGIHANDYGTLPRTWFLRNWIMATSIIEVKKNRERALEEYFCRHKNCLYYQIKKIWASYLDYSEKKISFFELAALYEFVPRSLFFFRFSLFFAIHMPTFCVRAIATVLEIIRVTRGRVLYRRSYSAHVPAKILRL